MTEPKSFFGQQHTPTCMRVTNLMLGGVVVASQTSDSQRLWVRVPPGPLLSNKLEQVIHTRGAQANSAFHPSWVGK